MPEMKQSLWGTSVYCCQLLTENYSFINNSHDIHHKQLYFDNGSRNYFVIFFSFLMTIVKERKKLTFVKLRLFISKRCKRFLDLLINSRDIATFSSDPFWKRENFCWDLLRLYFFKNTLSVFGTFFIFRKLSRTEIFLNNVVVVMWLCSSSKYEWCISTSISISKTNWK